MSKLQCALGLHTYFLYVDTCCVWGGFGRFRTYLGATTRCLLFAGTGGVFTQRANSPPVFALFKVLFSYFVFPHDHQRPSQTTETVHNCFSGPSLDRRNVLCGERAVLHRFLRFSRALSLESSLSAHSCRLIKRKSTTSCHGRPFDHPFYSRHCTRGRTCVAAYKARLARSFSSSYEG